MDFNLLIEAINSWLSGLPLLVYVITIGIICTVAFRMVQFRLFIQAWKVTLAPAKQESHDTMTPFQAFINTLSASIGNGSIAGVATAVYSGGPGSAFWIVVFGFIMMAVRFAEVYTSTWYSIHKQSATTSGLGGPMLYLKDVIGGDYLAGIYAVACTVFGLTVGNAMQANSIALAMYTTWKIPYLVVALCMFFFVAYILYGGDKRIIAASDTIVPLKVFLFFSSALIILCYHYAAIPHAFYLIVHSAFSSSALTGAAYGISVMAALRYGLNRSILATESGLGTIAILFGFNKQDGVDPLRSALMGMIGTFISTIVCFLVVLCIVVSDVWSTGLMSTALTIAAFNTVFGVYGGWLVSFLSVSFGIGVLVAYAYITRASFLYLTGGRYMGLFIILYCLAAFCGAITTPTLMFAASDIPLAILLYINLFGLLYLLPQMSKAVRGEQNHA